MRVLLWVLLSGLLSATLGQEPAEQDALAELASNGGGTIQVKAEAVSSQGEPAHKTSEDILEAVGAVVASLNQGILQTGTGAGDEPTRVGESSDPTTADEDGGGDAEATGGDAEATGGDAEASGGAAEDNAASEAGEPSVTTTQATVEAAEATEIPTTTPDATVNQPEVEEPETSTVSKKTHKAVEKYNEAVDQILKILSPRLLKAEGFPLNVDEATLTALDASDDPAPSPEPEPEPEPGRTRAKKRRKNMNKRKRKNKKNKKIKNKNNQEEEEEGGGAASETTPKMTSTKKKNKKNKPPQEAAAGQSEEKNKAKNKNKGRRKKNKKNRNKNKKNKGRTDEEEREEGVTTLEGEEQTREGRGLLQEGDQEEREAAQEVQEEVQEGEEEEEDVTADSGQNLKGKSDKKSKKKKNKNKRGKKGGGKKKNNDNNNNKKKNKNNKNKNKGGKKNKKNKKDSKGRSDIPDAEEKGELGPVLPTQEEVASSNALLVGFTKVTHEGDVSVDLSGNHPQFEAKVLVGPLSVQLADRRRALTKSQVTATLAAQARFRVKSVRGRDRIKLLQVDVTGLEPAHVKVTRSDLSLEPQLVSAAQDQVVQAVDVARIGRILSSEIEAILEADDRLQNLQDHPFLQE